jgi:hypothetical protein
MTSAPQRPGFSTFPSAVGGSPLSAFRRFGVWGFRRLCSGLLNLAQLGPLYRAEIPDRKVRIRRRRSPFG